MFKKIVSYIENNSDVKKIICFFAIIGVLLTSIGLYILLTDDNLMSNIVESTIIVNREDDDYIRVTQNDNSQEWKDYQNNFSKYNHKIDFDVLKMSICEDENIVYSPLSIKRALSILKKLTDGTSNQQISNLGNLYTPKFPNDMNKSSQTGVFIKNISSDIETNANDLLKYSDNFSLNVVDSITPNIVNDWAFDCSYGNVDKIFDDNEDLSDAVFILSNVSMIDMNWIHRIERGAFLQPYHENFHFQTINFDVSGYKSLLFNDINVSALEFGASANKYDIITELGYDNIRNTVYKAYCDWYVSDDKYTVNPISPDEYIEDYMEEISSNYGKYDSSTDFEYYIDDNIKVFCKSLSNYDSLDLEYIGIMPINDKLYDYVQNFDGEKLTYILSNLNGASYYDFKEGYCTKVHGSVPIFEYESSLDLKEIMSNLGVEHIFDQTKSNFTVLSKRVPIYVSDFISDSNITFSNDGIKALSSTTTVGLGAGASEFDYYYDVPIIDIDLTFDKPFMYIIRDKQSNQIFYIGVVYNPLEYIQFEGGEY